MITRKPAHIDTLRIAVAGGGTGGHVFPGIAVTDLLGRLVPSRIMWIGTGRQVEKNALQDRHIDYRVLKVHPIKGMEIPALVKALFHLPLSISRALSMLRDFRPHVVLGVGGYVSGPVLLAARLLGIPSAIHEQNLLPGLANRLSARFAARIFISFDESRKYFKKDRGLILTGNPVREDILEAARSSTVRPGDRSDFHILILGGSQGASSLNRLAGSAMKALWHSGHSFSFLHQTGEGDAENVRRFYQDAGVPARISPFIHDMGRAYMEADLVVCRAGATTIAELTVTGRPAIFIPYPYAAEGHQELNARLMEDRGAGIFLKEAKTGAIKLSSHIETLMEDRQKLAKMADKAKALGKPEAAQEIARNLMELAGLPVNIRQGGAKRVI